MKQSNSLHVLMLAPDYPPDYTTIIGRHIYYLSTSLVKIGVKVSVITMGLDGGMTSETVDGVEVHRVIVDSSDASDILTKAMFHQFEKIQDTHKVDILHIHDWGSASVSKQICANSSLPLVASYHTLASQQFFRTEATKQQFAIRQLIEGSVARSANYLLFKDAAMRQQGQESLGFRTDQVGVIPYGVLPQPANPSLRTEDFGRYFLNADAEVVCITGCEAMENRESFLCDVMAIVTSRYPSLRFVVLTPFAMTGLMEKLRLDDKVVFLTDYICREILSAVYQCSSLLVAPATDSLRGLTVAEAMSCRTPILVFGQGGLEAQLEDKRVGLHIASDEPHIVAGAIIDACKKKKRLAEMAAAAYEQSVSKYDALFEAESTLSVYKQVI